MSAMGEAYCAASDCRGCINFLDKVVADNIADASATRISYRNRGKPTITKDVILDQVPAAANIKIQASDVRDQHHPAW